jgi:hypothetical protein
MKTGVPKKLSLEEIKLEPRLMVRASLDQDAIADYTVAMEVGAKFPPLDVFAIDGGYYLADGWHRYHAAQKLGCKDILVIVHNGDAKAALAFALKANQQHGLRRTNADKRKSVDIALQLWPDLSSRGIADLCGVGDGLVNERRQVLESSTSNRTGKDGKTYPASAPASKITFPDPEREDEKKDAAESADGDHDQRLPLESARAWSGKAQEIAEAIKLLEGMERGNIKTELAANTCRQMAGRLEKLAKRIEQ